MYLLCLFYPFHPPHLSFLSYYSCFSFIQDLLDLFYSTTSYFQDFSSLSSYPLLNPLILTYPKPSTTCATSSCYLSYFLPFLHLLLATYPTSLPCYISDLSHFSLLPILPFPPLLPLLLAIVLPDWEKLWADPDRRTAGQQGIWNSLHTWWE